MIKKILILGGEGNGGVVAGCIKDMNKRFGYQDLKVSGFLNDKVEIGSEINGYPVMGKTEDVHKFGKENYYFVFAICPIAKGQVRINLFDRLCIPEERLLTIVHPSSFIGEGTFLSPGVVVMPNCFISIYTKIGVGTYINAGASIGHHSKIGRLCFCSRSSVIGSYISIGDASDVSLNATVIEKVKIGTCSVVGAGAMLRNDIGDYEIHVGIPAKLLKKLK